MFNFFISFFLVGVLGMYVVRVCLSLVLCLVSWCFLGGLEVILCSCVVVFVILMFVIGWWKEELDRYVVDRSFFV